MATGNSNPGGFRVEVCGGIASGKTTFVQICQSAIETTVFEDFSSNPFYEVFYQDPEYYAFETEVTFLLQHYSAIRDAQIKGGTVCADFSILLDAAYAKVNLAGGRAHAFEAVLSQVGTEIGRPDILVHLRCSAEEERARIRHRRRATEIGIPLSYLEQINLAVAKELETVRGHVIMVDIDSETEDFAHNSQSSQQVVNMVATAIAKARAH